MTISDDLKRKLRDKELTIVAYENRLAELKDEIKEEREELEKAIADLRTFLRDLWDSERRPLLNGVDAETGEID